MENKQERLVSLDALRGFDMLFIMGLSSLVIAVCSLFPDGADCWLATTMKHVKWNGFAHHDTIFPLFLFIAGVSFPYSYAGSVAKGLPRRRIYAKTIVRGLVLVLLGIVYNGVFKLDFAHLRVASVLGRIGLAWMFAAILYMNFRTVPRIFIASAILVGYWLLIAFVPAPDAPGADPLTMEGSIVGFVDRKLMPGVLLYDGGRFDPEGLLSTVPAIVTAMLGMFTGEFVRSGRFSGGKTALCMAGAAFAMLAAGLLWSLVLPVNKMLWTSSFVLVAGAYSLGMFALFYYLADVLKWRKWTLFFRVVGMNSITIYLAQRIIGFWGATNFIFGGLAGICGEPWTAVISNAGYVAVCWLFLYFLYRHKIFLKI